MTKEFLTDIKTLQNQNKFHIAVLRLEAIENKDNFNQLGAEFKNAFYHLKAQCYYQDLKQPTKIRFKKALNILELKSDKENKETLRLKGAIYKRKYQHSKDLRDLYRAITYYEEAAKDVFEDLGYGAGNAVYLYFLLIKELKEKSSNDLIDIYLEKSKKIALDALTALNTKEKYSYLRPWHYASKSALHLSLEQFNEAKQALQMYKDKSNNTIDRDQAITIKQTIELFDVLPNEHDEEELLNILSMYDDAKSMISSVRKGKIGLALSGGGFRASLFHIGTFMRLAELDILRNVQVISTVSGGSIIGMYYYLEVKKLLEEKSNEMISKQDYIDLVERIRINFSKAIRENNIRILAFQKKPKEDLTEKLGKLYQEKLYNPIFGDHTTIKNMSELKIKPKIGNENKTDFIPEFHNFELENKVPRIIVNATLLNNGHNWQFTDEGMGENKYMTDMSIENNNPYEFKYYPPIKELDENKYMKKDIAISSAVASSSAVPILFDPICLKKDEYGYPDTLKLSDGGLYDNLGLSSLLADECTHIIVSDGSKQLETDKDPSIFRLDVSSRTTDVLMHRTRDGEYKMAKNLQERGIIEGLAIVHLNGESSTIDYNLQKKLASIRTDLDSFHELEAEGLMYAGYAICSDWFNQENHLKNWKNFKLDYNRNEEKIENIEYFKIFKENIVNKENILDISSKVFFKTLNLLLRNPYIRIFIFGFFLLFLKEYPIYTLLIIFTVIIFLYGGFKKTIKYIVKFISIFLMIPISIVHKFIFTKLYVYWGQLNEK